MPGGKAFLPSDVLISGIRSAICNNTYKPNLFKEMHIKNKKMIKNDIATIRIGIDLPIRIVVLLIIPFMFLKHKYKNSERFFMKVIVCENYEELSEKAAAIVACQVKEKPSCVLGLATGSTPVGTYRILCDMYKKGELDFSLVTSFNLDEYYPIDSSDSQSYRFFMEENLFGKINIPKDSTHIPGGMASDALEECSRYEALIEEKGPIDLQILGIGQNGHIGFNEPDTALHASTHVTELTDSTIAANSRFFESYEDVPRRALTMGIGTILKSKKIILLACGKAKHDVVAKMLDDAITTENPATLLKTHADVTLICDKEALYG